MQDVDIEGYTPQELLALYAKVMRKLRSKDVISSSNNPVADVCGFLVTKAFRLERAGKSEKGFDAIATDCTQYEIKGRRLTSENRSRHLSNKGFRSRALSLSCCGIFG